MSREQRKVVTILFADLVGSTALAGQSDPEVVRATMGRYFQRIAEVAEAYGGTVEKFAGDAAMVVFGVPTVHDDDAERAVRAALEIRDGAAELAVRVGVTTGAGGAPGAGGGGGVLGLLPEKVTRKGTDSPPREPVTAKGKPQPLEAFRAVRPRTHV